MSVDCVEVGGVVVLRANVCGNADYLEIHSRLKLPTFGLSADKAKPSELHDELMAIVGVTESYCYDGYRVAVKKGQLFSHDELAPQVLSVIAKHVGIEYAAAK